MPAGAAGGGLALFHTGEDVVCLGLARVVASPAYVYVETRATSAAASTRAKTGDSHDDVVDAVRFEESRFAASGSSSGSSRSDRPSHSPRLTARGDVDEAVDGIGEPLGAPQFCTVCEGKLTTLRSKRPKGLFDKGRPTVEVVETGDSGETGSASGGAEFAAVSLGAPHYRIIPAVVDRHSCSPGY